jgi:RNA-splicing ligase RtcB
MIEITGTNGICQVMTDHVDENALAHLKQIMSAGITEDTIVRVMPDYHEGVGSVIGFTQKLSKNNLRICPNVVGVDIGCRISAVKFGKLKNLDFQEFDTWIRKNIPLSEGKYLPEFPQKYESLISDEELELFEDATKLIEEDGSNFNLKFLLKVPVLNQLVSVGGGNHFIELNVDKTGKHWLSLHCGSRNFGWLVAKIYQTYAEQYCSEDCNNEMKWFDKDCKYLDRYLTCLHACQVFSEVNHRIIFQMFSDYFQTEIEDSITTLHNYIDLDNMILRKGAISAQKNERVLIPFNMKDGIAIGTGKGNAEYNYSAPHGAGRVLSRNQAKKQLNLDEVKSIMKEAGIFTTSLDYALDEAPAAYKNSEEILKYIEPTVSVTEILKPIYNIKG